MYTKSNGNDLRKKQLCVFVCVFGGGGGGVSVGVET